MKSKNRLPRRIERQLIDAVGEKRFSTAAEHVLCASYDATQLSYLPLCVIRPENCHQVSRVLIIANENRIPVTPRGAGTGLSGGAIPRFGGIVLSMAGMNRILSLDSENLVAEVEPGVITADLELAAARKGLFYPPDPASMDMSTIGGNVAESAGGPRAVKYGVTRDYVLGLEAVLPTGDIIFSGARTTKCVVGYDMTRLIVGSEGTLAVITRLFLKLIPRPEAMITMLIVFSDVAAAARSVSSIIAACIVPATLEFMDKSTIECVRSEADGMFPDEAGAVLIVEIDGPHEILSRQRDSIIEICHQAGAISVRTAESDEDRRHLWKARRAVSPALHKIAPNKINEDIVVPRSKVPAILLDIDAIARRHQLRIITFGHAGDGNIHVNIMTDTSQEGADDKAHAAVKDIFRATLSHGGTISGEHGIGMTKSPFIDMELTHASLRAMHAIKMALDPRNILNPGKIFPPSWNHNSTDATSGRKA